MPKTRSHETIGTLVKAAIDEGCQRLDITRGELAERIGMHRVSLYNTLARPGGISLQSLVRIMDELRLPPARQGQIVYKWSEDRMGSNPFAELLFPVLDEVRREARLSDEEVGRRILDVFRRMNKK